MDKLIAALQDYADAEGMDYLKAAADLFDAVLKRYPPDHVDLLELSHAKKIPEVSDYVETYSPWGCDRKKVN